MKEKSCGKIVKSSQYTIVHSATGQRIFVIAETFKFENNPPRDA